MPDGPIHLSNSMPPLLLISDQLFEVLSAIAAVVSGSVSANSFLFQSPTLFSNRLHCLQLAPQLWQLNSSAFPCFFWVNFPAHSEILDRNYSHLATWLMALSEWGIVCPELKPYNVHYTRKLLLGHTISLLRIAESLDVECNHCLFSSLYLGQHCSQSNGTCIRIQDKLEFEIRIAQHRHWYQPCSKCVKCSLFSGGPFQGISLPVNTVSGLAFVA